MSVLEEAQRTLVSLPGFGVSPLEATHRGKWFDGVLADTKANFQKLLSLPDDFEILFLQGGSRLQFAMAPMNLLAAGQSADYIVTGTWGKSAVEEAQHLAKARRAYDGKPHNFDRLPQTSELDLDPQAGYVHFTSNETIQGVQFADEPRVGNVPLVCDASSDFLHRPLPMDRYGLLYACAQKNAGPAGVTVVFIRKHLLARSGDHLPSMLNYKQNAENDSRLNTPPVFGVYIVQLVTRWLLDEIGGLEKMHQLNRDKAKVLYDVVDSSGGFYQGHAQPNCRSLMNVTFRLPDEAKEKKFLAGAEERGLHYLKGHRSVGGIRASIYNAMPAEGVQKLADWMRQFAKG